MGRSNTITITVSAPLKKQTTLTLQADKYQAITGENITLTAYLTETGTGLPIAGKPIKFYTSTGTLIDTRTTNSQGYCSTIISPGIAGSYSYYAEFSGDNEYEGCGEDANQQDYILHW